MSADFYEAVPVEVGLPAEIKPGNLNRILKTLGATLSYDTYSFDRDDIYPPWQSDIYAILNLSRSGSLVDAQDVVDCIVAEYPMASIGSEFIVRFAGKVFEISDALNGTVVMDGLKVTKDELIGNLDGVAGRLLSERGKSLEVRHLQL
ncbi:hypothetical protein [Paracoccus siganidrum]|uniref:hypothetical protein n=1 Tax=Paracoccus siganidrum TaxID=1276757 RepID=UPI0011C4356C|nr:hypothetical protein [Paracoccus siganidrum]